METKSELRPLVSLPRPPQALYGRFGHLSFDRTIKFLAEGSAEMMRLGFPTKHLQQAFCVREKAVGSPKLHKRSFVKNHDFLLHVSIPRVGTTSYTVFHDILDSSTKERLFRIETKMVNIDYETRRPWKLPTVFIEESSRFSSDDRVLITEIQNEIIPPKNAFKTMSRTRYSDTDVNLHVHFVEYYGFCAECASEASQSGYYRHYDDDMCKFPVLEADATFIGEAGPCSNLDVYTWQEHTENLFCNLSEISQNIPSRLFVR
ncbi:hypothetical protein KP79_PYT04891 [Mizuhopecten yessoensis]|uniref:Uncharacterized protein n=1 Tax=Mizuhopecten yessoensis TaxID=6573 RepID=A0A210PGT5_MIZYE|nr:hypothetical protein KP79_PYT04891 [Mizuhopecten yessoensis]